MKRLLVSHNDLDGISCLFLAWYFRDKLDITEMISRDYEFAEDEEEFDYLQLFDEILITDLSISEERTKALRDKGIIVRFFDHHESSLWLKEDKDSVHSLEECGTSLFWKNFVKPKISRYPIIIDQYVTLVDTYDMWKDEDELWNDAKDLNTVLYGIRDYSSKDALLSVRPFFQLMGTKFRKLSEWRWTEKEKEIIEKANKREEELYQKALRELSIRTDKKGRKFGVFTLPAKISVIASRILKEREDLDYVVIFNTYGGLTGRVSFRSRKMNLHELGLAKGHVLASGGVLTPDLSIKFLEDESYVFVYTDEYDEKNIKTAIARI